jgi:hypothetical protein
MKLGPKEIKVVNEYFVRPVKNRLKEIFLKKGLPQLKNPDEIQRPQRALDKEAIDAFMKRNPMADGGRINFDGGGSPLQKFRQEIVESMKPYAPGDVTEDQLQLVVKDITLDMTAEQAQASALSNFRKLFGMADGGRIGFNDGTPVKFDKFRVKIPTGEFVGEGRDKSEIFKIKNTKSGSVRYTTTGAGGGKKKLYTSIEEVKKAKLPPDELVKVDSKIIKEGIKEVTYKNKKTNKIVKYYKPRVGEAKKTIPGKGTTSLKEAEKFIKDYYIKNPKPVRDPKKDYASKDLRTQSLKETDPTKAVGTKKYNYHHVRQIAGGVPLTSDDVMVINQRINSKIGGKFNESLNRISAAIQKNNRLALEAMNNKQEGPALDYMKRSDELNAQAEKIVNSAIDDLPKKYKGYVGFNKFTLPRDEYGLPISNEPMLIKKVGGMPVSKDAIDLTNLNLKDEAKFRKIVKQQAERGKVGKIDVKKMISDGPTLGMNLGFLKGFGEAIKSVPTPAGAVALNLGLGVDPTSAIDRAGIAAEAAFAPQLVKQSAKFGPVAQRFFNLGLTPAMAARAARIASPLGIASLAAEGLYQGGKFTKKRIEELRSMTPEQREELRRQGEARAFDPFQAAGGGIAKQAGDRSGPMLKSMNPDKDGLLSLMKRGKKI